MVVYNLGQQDIMVRDTSVRINDGKYHVVRFIRTGVNSSLQVDDNQVMIRIRSNVVVIHQGVTSAISV